MAYHWFTERTALRFNYEAQMMHCSLLNNTLWRDHASLCKIKSVVIHLNASPCVSASATSPPRLAAGPSVSHCLRLQSQKMTPVSARSRRKRSWFGLGGSDSKASKQTSSWERSAMQTLNSVSCSKIRRSWEEEQGRGVGLWQQVWNPLYKFYFGYSRLLV